MNLDLLAERAAADLLVEADRKPIPTVAQLVGARRSGSVGRRLLGAAAAVAVVAAGLTLLGRDDSSLPFVEHPTSARGVPAGIVPRDVEPPGMGIRLQLPSTWRGYGVTYGYDVTYIEGLDGQLSVARFATTEPLDVDEFADVRRGVLAESRYAVTVDDVKRTSIDGRDAVVIRYESATGVLYTEYDIELDDGTWVLVAIGERSPVERRDVLDWVASTIEVHSSPLWSAPIEHPAPREAPDGVTPRRWSPEGLGVSVEVPATWAVSSETSPAGFDHGRVTTNGAPAFVLASRVAHALGSPDDRVEILERQFRARDIVRIDTVVDGHAATILRYRIPYLARPRLAALDTEYVIDMEDGTFVWLAIGTRGGAEPELLEWIRSTIRVDP